MDNYIQLVEDVLEYGESRPDRTGVGTLSLFDTHLTFNLAHYFPALQAKKLFWHGVATELCWFLRGDTNVTYLRDRGVRIWDEWADECGNLGPVYGAQWKKQLESLIEGLRNDPMSRRHILDSWQLEDLPLMALPPCHVLFQCYVSMDGYMSMKVYQRSADLFLGVPFNIASYALLVHVLCYYTGHKPGDLTLTFGDTHIYENHIDQCKYMIQQHNDHCVYAVELTMNIGARAYYELEPEQFQLRNYYPGPIIKGDIAV